MQKNTMHQLKLKSKQLMMRASLDKISNLEAQAGLKEELSNQMPNS